MEKLLICTSQENVLPATESFMLKIMLAFSWALLEWHSCKFIWLVLYWVLFNIISFRFCDIDLMYQYNSVYSTAVTTGYNYWNPNSVMADVSKYFHCSSYNVIILPLLYFRITGVQLRHLVKKVEGKMMLHKTSWLDNHLQSTWKYIMSLFGPGEKLFLFNICMNS